jgi:hypothetical protein
MIFFRIDVTLEQNDDYAGRDPNFNNLRSAFSLETASFNRMAARCAQKI